MLNLFRQFIQIPPNKRLSIYDELSLSSTSIKLLLTLLIMLFGMNMYQEKILNYKKKLILA